MDPQQHEVEDKPRKRDLASGIEHPDIEVRLLGKDGNVFAIIGAVSKALKKAGLKEEAEAYVRAAMASDSYGAVLRLTMKTVNVS